MQAGQVAEPPAAELATTRTGMAVPQKHRLSVSISQQRDVHLLLGLHGGLLGGAGKLLQARAALKIGEPALVRLRRFNGNGARGIGIWRRNRSSRADTPAPAMLSSASLGLAASFGGLFALFGWGDRYDRPPKKRGRGEGGMLPRPSAREAPRLLVLHMPQRGWSWARTRIYICH